MVYLEGIVQLGLLLRRVPRAEPVMFISQAPLSLRSLPLHSPLKLNKQKQQQGPRTPATYILLGWEPGTCLRQRTQLLGLLHPFDRWARPKGKFCEGKSPSKRRDRLQGESIGAPAQVLGWHSAPSAAYLTCHRKPSGFHCLSVEAVWFCYCSGPLVSPIVFLCFSSMFDNAYHVSGIMSQNCLCPCPWPWGVHRVEEQMGTRNSFHSMWQRLQKSHV